MALLRGLRDRISRAFFGRIIYHRPAVELPPIVRRRLYAQLLDLINEENRISETLEMPVGPRLNVVDEARVAILRPSDRMTAFNDEEYKAARRDANADADADSE